MTAIPRPHTLSAAALTGAAGAVRPRAEPAWSEAAGWEEKVRRTWDELATFPWRGVPLRQRAARLARSAASLVEGPHSEMFRAARIQRRWALDVEPLRSAVALSRQFVKAGRELLTLAVQQEEAAADLRERKVAWADFPRAWHRWTGLLMLNEAAIFAGGTADELTDVRKRMLELEQELTRWRDEVGAWLASRGGAGDDALTVSERRYLSLLSIGTADRGAASERSVALLRQGTTAQLEGVTDASAPRYQHLVWSVARHWCTRPAAVPVCAEELACYRAAFDHGYARDHRPEPASARESTDTTPALPGRIPRTALFATPLVADGDGPPGIVVRRMPQSPLLVELTDTSTEAFVQVALPDSAPPLSPREFAAYRPFFDIPDALIHPYWWATRRPARVHLQQVGGTGETQNGPVPDTVFVGQITQRGQLEPLSAPAAQRPRVSSGTHLFRAYAPPEAGHSEQHLDHDPRIRPHRMVLRSGDVEAWLATVPEYGPERLWLRTTAHAPSAPVRAAAFDAEVEFLAHLSVELPGSVARVAHRGTVDLERRGRRTPYLATAAPLGHGIEEWLRADPEAAEHWAVHLAADLLHTLRAAHAAGYCVGDLAPPLVRVRPAFHASPSVLRATLAAAPMAGRVDEPFRDAGRRAPDWPGSPSPRSARSVAGDLVSLGCMLTASVAPLVRDDNPVPEFAAALQAGVVASADDALHRLAAAAPTRVAHFRSTVGVRAGSAAADGATS